MSKWTKQSDWQPIPQSVSRDLPVCPLCKKRTEWEIHDDLGWSGLKGYKFTCGTCGAEWKWKYKINASMFFAGSFESLNQMKKITDDGSIWVLTETGDNKEAERLLEKEVNFSTWKQMSGSFCGKCGNPLAENEKFCPKCGEKRGKDD